MNHNLCFVLLYVGPTWSLNFFNSDTYQMNLFLLMTLSGLVPYKMLNGQINTSRGSVEIR